MSGRVFNAATQLLLEGGSTHVTFQNVATRAQVGRATLYRRWATPTHLIADAIRAVAAETIVVPDTGSLIGDLRVVLSDVAAFVSSPLGRAALVASLQMFDATSVDDTRWVKRWADVAPMFDRAQARGELAATANAQMLFAQAAGAIYFRLLVMHAPVTDDWIDAILADFKHS